MILESSVALAEYNARKQARVIRGTNKEIIAQDKETDDAREIWQWGLMAVVLHRRYRFTAPKVVEILNDIQALHNELWDPELGTPEQTAKILKFVDDEVGLEMLGEEWEGAKNGTH